MLNKSALANEEIESVKEPPMSAAKRAAQAFKKNTIDYIFRDKPEFEGSSDDVIVPMRSRKKKSNNNGGVGAYSCWNHRLCS